MEKGLTFKLGKKLKDEKELEIGKYYHFFNEVYLYCGCIEPFNNAYAFGCPAGTLFVNKAQVTELLETKEIMHATLVKTK